MFTHIKPRDAPPPANELRVHLFNTELTSDSTAEGGGGVQISLLYCKQVRVFV